MAVASALTVAIAAVFFLSAPKEAVADTVKIVSMEIGDGLQTATGRGFYRDIVLHVLNNSNQPFEFEVHPLKRALRAFFDGGADCIWALESKLLREMGFTEPDLVDSEPFFVSRQHIFMAPGVPAISTLDELAGKTVGILSGSNIEEILESVSAKVVTVPDPDTKVRMLIGGRLDAIGTWLPDILVTFHNHNVPPTSFNPAIVLGSSNVGIACRKTPQNLSFLDKVNAEIRRFVGSDSFQSILRNYGVKLD